MPIRSDDIVPLSQVRARFSELAEDVQSGGQKIVTRNGQSYVAIIGARQLDHYRRLEQQHIHLLLLDEAERALEDVAAGRVVSAEEMAKRYGR